LATEKRLLELRIQDLEHRLYGSSSEKLPIEDRQLALINEVFDNPEPATTEVLSWFLTSRSGSPRSRCVGRCPSTSKWSKSV
jgi:hypothetical protein